MMKKITTLALLVLFTLPLLGGRKPINITGTGKFYPTFEVTCDGTGGNAIDDLANVTETNAKDGDVIFESNTCKYEFADGGINGNLYRVTGPSTSLASCVVWQWVEVITGSGGSFQTMLRVDSVTDESYAVNWHGRLAEYTWLKRDMVTATQVQISTEAGCTGMPTPATSEYWSACFNDKTGDDVELSVWDHGTTNPGQDPRGWGSPDCTDATNPGANNVDTTDGDFGISMSDSNTGGHIRVDGIFFIDGKP